MKRVADKRKEEDRESRRKYKRGSSEWIGEQEAEEGGKGGSRDNPYPGWTQIAWPRDPNENQEDQWDDSSESISEGEVVRLVERNGGWSGSTNAAIHRFSSEGVVVGLPTKRKTLRQVSTRKWKKMSGEIGTIKSPK